MEYGIMFFSSSCDEQEYLYRLLLHVARFADQNDFAFVSTPERHFHQFGGAFPNPAVISAALATITERVQLRAGSLISPLHDTIRIVEEWSAVDRLSKGRVAISFGAGWNVNDFMFYPERYEQRQAFMYDQIAQIRRLWQGEKVERSNSFGREVSVTLWPKPHQRDLPIWVTTSGNIETFISAGRLGANLLTHLIGQDLSQLAEKIKRYRDARAEGGHDPDQGKVTLMLHTYLGEDIQTVKDTIREPFKDYLRTAVSLELKAAEGGGAISGGHQIKHHEIGSQDMEDLLEVTFNRYFSEGALMGTPQSCLNFVSRLREIGVHEIACLIDFHEGAEAITAGLAHLNTLRKLTSETTLRQGVEKALSAFMDDLEL